MSTQPPSLAQNCSDSCLARDERNLQYRNQSNVRACSKRKTCDSSAVMATTLGQPWPKYCGLLEFQVYMSKLSWLISYLTTYFSSWICLLKLGIFTIHFTWKTVPRLPQGASRVHANLSYLFKADILKGQILVTEKVLAMSFTVHLLLHSFYSDLAKAPSTKKVWKRTWKNISLPVPCLLLSAFVIWLHNNPKLKRREGQTIKAVIFTYHHS